MKATVTYKGFEFDDQSVDQGAIELSNVEYFSFLMANYFASKDRTYKASLGVIIDTVSIHANESDIGFRFYHKTPKAKNKRHAYYYQIIVPIDDILNTVKKVGFSSFCDNLTEDAVREIIKQEN